MGRAHPGQAVGPATVLLANGTYYLRRPLRLGPDDAHTAYAGDRGGAVLSGGKLLTPAWRHVVSGVAPRPGSKVQAHVGAGLVSPKGLGFGTLFVGGARRWRARVPNGNPERDLQPTNMIPPDKETLWLQPPPPKTEPVVVSIAGGLPGRGPMTPLRNTTQQWDTQGW